MEEWIQCELRKQIATVTINRPEALNALNPNVLRQLGDALTNIEQEKDIKAIILTGAGNKAFVAGADIAAMQHMTPKQAKQFSAYGQSVLDRIAKMRTVVIAAVNGFALGGGCELAMACDIRIASSNAKFGIPEVSLGVIPGFGGTQRLVHLVGTGRAMELMATGSQITAEEAYRIGLVNRVTLPEELLRCCEDLARQIAGNSSNAIALGKQCVYAGIEMELARGLAFENSMFALSFADADQDEGMTAFLEKRKPHFND